MLDDAEELELLMRLIKRHPEDYAYFMGLFEDIKNPKYTPHIPWWNEVD